MADYGIRPPGYRLPDATRLGGLDLQVSDLERSVAYYGDVLGLRVLARTVDTAGLAAEGETAPLVRLRVRPGARPVPRRGLLGLYHFALLLPDRAGLGRFAAHLGAAGIYAGSADHAVSEALYLTDPDGLGIEIYADRPRSTWRQQGQELLMTTAPLDIRGLAAAAGGRQWTGMPAGTVLGHVHLHVGDLAGAAAFYHQALGLDKTVWSYPGALFLSAGGYHHHLGTNIWSSGPPASDEDARLLSWDLVLPSPADTAAAARSLESAGHPVHQLSEGWIAADPWGTAVKIVDEGAQRANR